MKKLKSKEMTKRGCRMCTDMSIRRGGLINGVYKENYYICNHDECPYHELDKYETFDEYLESEESKFDFKDFAKGLN